MDKYVFGFFVATSIFTRCSSFLLLGRPHRSTESVCDQLQIYSTMKQCYGALIDVTEMNLEGKGEEVTAMCRHAEAADHCFRTRMLECGQGGATVSEMLENVFKFACGAGLSSTVSLILPRPRDPSRVSSLDHEETRDGSRGLGKMGVPRSMSVVPYLGLLSEEACWKQETLKDDIAMCTGSMEAGFKTEGYNSWCRLTREYISCVGDKIQATPKCSSRATDYVTELMRRSYEPAARNMRCDLRTREVRELLD